MDNFIFNPINKTESSTSFEYYGVLGAEDFLDNESMPRMSSDSPKVYAKKIINSDSGTKYCVKISNNNKLIRRFTNII